jgi:hypothetical protein
VKGVPVKFKVGLCSIIMFISFISCNQGDQGDIELVRIAAVEIPERINQGQAVHFTMHCETPTPGYEFHHTEISESVFFDIYVKVYAKRLRGGWITMLDSFITSDRFVPDSRGNYTVHFYQRYPSEYLIKVVNVQ